MEIKESPKLKKGKCSNCFLKGQNEDSGNYKPTNLTLVLGWWDQKGGVTPLIRHFWAQKEKVLGERMDLSEQSHV